MTILQLNKYDSSLFHGIKASFLTKTLSVEGKRITLAIWDTAGQEKFHALGPIYYRGATGMLALLIISFLAAILVFDVTDRASFDRVQGWVKELKRATSDDIIIAIAENKIDLERQRVVPHDEAAEYFGFLLFFQIREVCWC